MTDSATVNGAHVRVPGSVYLAGRRRQIPVGEDSAEGTRYDLRTGQEIGDRQIELACTNLKRDDDGRVRVRLALHGPPNGQQEI